MIKFEHTEVMNFEGAIRGMRNPLNSWDKSDSGYYNQCDECYSLWDYRIGPNDLALMKRLIKAGPDHRKFLRQIIVSVDITAPLYWWKEFDTYKVGTVANSCSTMHKIHEKPFTREDFSHEHLIDSSDEEYQYENPSSVLDYVIGALNHHRQRYLETKDKKHWWQMIQLLPSSYNQKRTVTLNYETLYNIYGSRRNHKLDEWSIGFINWIESLPYAKELITDRG